MYFKHIISLFFQLCINRSDRTERKNVRDLAVLYIWLAKCNPIVPVTFRKLHITGTGGKGALHPLCTPPLSRGFSFPPCRKSAEQKRKNSAVLVYRRTFRIAKPFGTLFNLYGCVQRVYIVRACTRAVHWKRFHKHHCKANCTSVHHFPLFNYLIYIPSKPRTRFPFS